LILKGEVQMQIDMLQALKEVNMFNEFWTYDGSLTSPALYGRDSVVGGEEYAVVGWSRCRGFWGLVRIVQGRAGSVDAWINV